MRRSIAIVVILCLLVGATLCLPQVKRTVFLGVMIVAEHLGVPLDDASARAPRVGRYEEYTIDDPIYDVLTYYFNGSGGQDQDDVANAGMEAIRKGGFNNHSKKMTLIIFCNLTSINKSPKTVYPFGLFVESERIMNRTVPVKDLTGSGLIKSPMNWDDRINEWIYTTNNTTRAGPEITENADYAKSTNVLERGWYMHLDALKDKAQVCEQFGAPKFYVREHGANSEVYPVDDRSQAGTVRVWYEAGKVVKTGCYMDNKQKSIK